MSEADHLTAEATGGLGRRAARGGASTLVGQVIRLSLQMTSIVILGRLLAPQDFGLVAMVMAVVGVADLLRDFGLSMAAMQARTLSLAQKSNLFWLNGLFGAVLAVAVYFGSGAVASLYGEPRLEDIAKWLSLSFLFTGVAAQYRVDLARRLLFGRLALIDVAAQVAALSAGVLAALSGVDYWALVIQQLALTSTTVCLLVLISRWRPGRPRRAVGMRPLFAFGSNLFSTQMIGYVSRNVDSVVVGTMFGAQSLGLYNRAFQLISLPLTQLQAPATQVAVPVLTRVQDDAARYRNYILHGQVVLLHAATILLASGAALADILIPLVIGQDWTGSVPLFQILAIGGVFQAASYGTYWVFLSQNQTASLLKYSLVSRPIVIAAVLSGSFWGVNGVAIGYSLSIACIWPLGLLWLRRVSGELVYEMLSVGFRAILSYGTCSALAYTAGQIAMNVPAPERLAIQIGTLIVSFICACLVYRPFRRDVCAVMHAGSLLRA